MSRTYRHTHSNTTYLKMHSTWGNKTGTGKYFKRAYNKAHRRAFKGTGGKDRTVAALTSELKYKGT